MNNLVKFKNRNLPSIFGGFESLFDNDLDGLFLAPWKHFDGLPKANVIESDKEFNVDIALPGIAKDEVKITIDDNILTVEKEQKQEKEEKNEKYNYKEFSYSSFRRSFALPDGVDADKIKSKYKDGILGITIPKNKEQKFSKTIEIE